MGRTMTQIGPFRACIDPTTDLIYLNYAVPVWALGTEEETSEQLIRLRDLFHQSERRLRFEFVDGIWPGLCDALELFGLRQQDRLPLMACTAETFQPMNAPGVTPRMVDAANDADLRAFYQLQRRAFDAEVEPSPEEIAQLRHQIENGFWHCAIAEVAGEPVGVGSTLPWTTLCELAGVGTLPASRRMGVAGTLSSFLVRHHFDRGGDLIWLTAATDAARATYERIGFTHAGVAFHYMESDSPVRS